MCKLNIIVLLAVQLSRTNDTTSYNRAKGGGIANKREMMMRHVKYVKAFKNTSSWWFNHSCAITITIFHFRALRMIFPTKKRRISENTQANLHYMSLEITLLAELLLLFECTGASSENQIFRGEIYDKKFIIEVQLPSPFQAGRKTSESSTNENIKYFKKIYKYINSCIRNVNVFPELVNAENVSV